MREYQRAMARFAACRCADKSHPCGTLRFCSVGVWTRWHCEAPPTFNRFPSRNVPFESWTNTKVSSSANGFQDKRTHQVLVQTWNVPLRPVAPSINTSMLPNTLGEPFCILGVLRVMQICRHSHTAPLMKHFSWRAKLCWRPTRFQTPRSSICLASAHLGR